LRSPPKVMLMSGCAVAHCGVPQLQCSQTEDVPLTADEELVEALGKLCSSPERFDSAIEVFLRHKNKALPRLQRLLRHPDPAWCRGAAAAMARLKKSSRNALPDLLRLLRNPDASAKIAAIAAIELLPPTTRKKAVPSIIRLLLSPAGKGPVFTQTRSNLPRAEAAHFLGAHGGSKGLAALRRVAARRSDPIIHHVDSALGIESPTAKEPEDLTV
jgi:hypothetical protein